MFFKIFLKKIDGCGESHSIRVICVRNGAFDRNPSIMIKAHGSQNLAPPN